MKKIKIAITGGIGSGKSTAAKYIKELGYPVFSCDEIYKDISRAPEFIAQIAELFPETVKDGKLDRKVLSDMVFADEEKLEKLNRLSHPLIMRTLSEKMEQSSSACVFAEVPLLFEGNYENLFDKVIVLVREEEKRIADLKLRDQANEGDILKRMRAQFDYTAKESLLRLKECGAVIIKNNGTFDSLKNVVQKIVAENTHS